MIAALMVAALNFAALMPKDADRAAFVGQTGSGKTTLARYVCTLRPYVVVLDPKGTTEWPGYERHTDLATMTKSKAPRLLYRPPYEDLHPEFVTDRMDPFFEWVYQRRNTTLYVDEVFAIARGDMYPFHFGANITRGRERGVATYLATQRPSRIPQIMLSESEHVYCFKLKLPQDRDRMEEVTGVPEEQLAALPKFQFYYAPQDGDAVGPLILDLGGRAPAVRSHQLQGSA